MACDFYGSMQECVHLCVCLCPKKMNAVKPLPVWNGGPIMTVSFSMQPCKTRLHEIDYPHTWTSFVTVSLSLALVTDAALSCSFTNNIKHKYAVILHTYTVRYSAVKSWTPWQLLCLERLNKSKQNKSLLTHKKERFFYAHFRHRKGVEEKNRKRDRVGDEFIDTE